MKNATTFSAALATTAVAVAFAVAGAPSAVADAHTTTLGSQAELVDGAVVQGWTVQDLKPSADAIPYPVRGVLWEATATDTAIAGSVTPIVSNFNARARNGDTYRVLFGAATPQGVNPATIAQGQSTKGKLYFDVTGVEPDSILYNAGGADLLLWVTPPPAPRGSGAGASGSRPPGTGTGGARATTGTATTPEAVPDSATAPTDAQPASVDSPATELPSGSSGTPLPPTSGSQGTPIEPTETPAGTTSNAPPAGGSQGTPVGTDVHGPGAAPGSMAPTTPAPSVAGQPTTPAEPAGSQGTPATATPSTATPSTTPIVPPPA